MTDEQTTTDCGPCDPHEIETLVCESTRKAREAEVDKEDKATRDGYRKSFASARADYTTAWKSAMSDVTSARAELEDLLKELRCRLDDTTRSHVDVVWAEVKAELNECAKATEGCKAETCDPDSSVGDDDTQATLAGRIQKLREQAKQQGSSFTRLLTEITELPKRAKAAKEAVTKIKAEAVAGGNPAETQQGKDAKNLELYARALVAGWQLDHVKGGFTSVDTFLDCLCRILTCVLKIWAAVVILEGEKAYKECVESTSANACTVLLADPLAVILDRVAKKAASAS